MSVLVFIFWRFIVVTARKVKSVIVEIGWHIKANEPLIETVAVSTMIFLFLLVFFFKVESFICRNLFYDVMRHMTWELFKSSSSDLKVSIVFELRDLINVELNIKLAD